MPNQPVPPSYVIVGSIFTKSGDIAGKLNFTFQAANDADAEAVRRGLENLFISGGNRSNLKIVKL